MNTIKTILTSYCLVLLVQPATALTISDGPLFLSVSIPPNVIMTLDDSGSMAWDYVPDSIGNASATKRKAASYNGLAYDPKLDYPIPQAKGRSYNTSFNKAYTNGFTQQNTKDLADSTYTLWYADAGVSPPRNCDKNRQNDDCYISRTVNTEEQQNYANWYSFYRTRQLTMISGAMQAIEGVDDGSIRIGWQALNTSTSFSTSGSDNRLKALNDSHRKVFYDWLEVFPASGATPLRSALQRAGDYLKNNKEPWWEDPYVREGTPYSCRKSFHVMFTDGMWNKDAVDFGGNVDNLPKDLPDGKRYAAMAPFRDDNNNSLADGAFKYWAEDLRSDLDNKVPASFRDRSGDATAQYWNPKNNPATWQHMVTFSIGLGLGETLTSENLAWSGGTWSGDGYKSLLDGTPWPNTKEGLSGSQSGGVGHVYDLWHAALNSRGQFFSADDPESLVMAFKSALDTIINSTPSSAALAANSTSLNTGSLIFQASLDSNLWSGKLLARQPQADGTIGSALWDASQLMPAPGERNIVIKKTSGAVAFKNCSDLDSNQQTALGKSGSDISACTNRINWLRGDDSKEVRKTGGVYRNRASAVTDKANPLGDIVNSDPVFTHAEDLGYGYKSGFSEAEKSGYANFLLTKKSAPPLVLVGANDGMLHAFRADTGNTDSGKELFAFIPYAVSTSLHKLTDPAYSHQYFVDGTVSVGDAYLNSTWKRVAIGGLGKGGKSVYALDISTPASFTASNVLWEYTESDMGYSFSQPQIARLNNGQWAAIFGNGYADNSNGKAILYIVNLSNGTLIKKIMTDTTTDNGLSTPVLYDKNKDGITDAVYAGDLKGRLWYFDLSNDKPNQWDVGIKSGNQAQPLFQAKNASNETQPITVKPFVQPHPSGGIILLFGTGQYLSSTDVSNKQLQSFYGIWHKPGKLDTLERANLQQQSITSEVQKFGFGLRETTANIVDWNSKSGWYMDLAFPANSTKGERVVFDAITKNGLVAFTTITPSSDPCTPGGMTWFMELQATTGGRTKVSPFDLNNDGKFDENDNLDSKLPANGISLPLGIAKPPVWLGNGPHYLKLFTGTNGGTTMIRNNKPGMTRMYWQQIL